MYKNDGDTGEDRSRVINLFPLVRSEKPFLVAVFPATVEAEVVPVLVAGIAEIRSTLDKQKGYARAFIGRLKTSSKRNLPLGEIGQFVGEIIRGFTS